MKTVIYWKEGLKNLPMYLSPLHGHLTIEDKKTEGYIHIKIIFIMHPIILIVRLAITTLISAGMFICSIHRRLNMTSDFRLHGRLPMIRTLRISDRLHADIICTYAHSTYLHRQMMRSILSSCQLLQVEQCCGVPLLVHHVCRIFQS